MLEMIREWMESLGGFLADKVLPAAILLAAGLLMIRIVVRLVKTILEKSKLEEVAHGLIVNVIRVVLYILLGLMVASHLGIDVTGVVALTSVLSLAVSLSVQDLLTNLISGFTLLYTKPFGTADYVEIAGQSGTVKEIGLTYTKLATPDNKLISIPNSAVTSAQIVNYTDLGTRRVDFSIQVSYEMEPELVIAALLEAAQVPTILADHTPFAAVRNYCDSTVEYTLQVWSTCDDYWTTLFEINKKIKAVFAAKGVEMTYPHLNVHLDK